jgi:hypothetical protein
MNVDPLVLILILLGVGLIALVLVVFSQQQPSQPSTVYVKDGGNRHWYRRWWTRDSDSHGIPVRPILY